MEALLQRGPSAPEPSDEAVGLLVSRVPVMGMELEQEERERAVALAIAVKNATANGLSAGGEVRLREILYRYWNAFVVTRQPVSSCEVARLPVSSR